MVPEDTPASDVESQTTERLVKFVEEIAELLERDSEVPEIRETDLSLDHLMEERGERIFIRSFDHRSASTVEARIARTISGEFVVDAVAIPETLAIPGSQILMVEGAYEITHVEPRYQDDLLRYYICTVREM